MGKSGFRILPIRRLKIFVKSLHLRLAVPLTLTLSLPGRGKGEGENGFESDEVAKLDVSF